jgi:hypothetical protein
MEYAEKVRSQFLSLRRSIPPMSDETSKSPLFCQCFRMGESAKPAEEPVVTVGELPTFAYC